MSGESTCTGKFGCHGFLEKYEVSPMGARKDGLDSARGEPVVRIAGRADQI
jgi:hypothetical protein